jgi:superfamily II DNA/RNA helicase
MLTRLIPGAIQVSGRDSEEAKEEAFTAFSSGQARVLVTKPSVGAWGLNFQHCAHITFFPSHSFEQHYQGIRRCWRFGQKRPVRADIVTSEGERGVLDNLRRKASLADQMFSRLVELMNQGQAVSADRNATKETRLPSWL